MISTRMQTLLIVAESQNFTKAAQALAMTQPAVSHHIKMLEEELGATLFVRGKNGLLLTPQGEIALRYARRIKALDEKMRLELQNIDTYLTNLKVGLTHTSESNLTTQVLAKCSSQHRGLNITITTDTIKNLYEYLANFEIDLAIVEGAVTNPRFSSMMLDTDYLVCVMSNDNPLSQNVMVTLSELKKQQMILRLPSSATRTQFESSLESHGDSITNYNVILELDNIATIKDLIRKDLGVSILPRSACMDELSKGKITALPIENLSMVRETRIVYNKDFAHVDILREITRIYQHELNALHF